MKLPWNDPESWSRLRAGEACPLCRPVAVEEVALALATSIVRVPPQACLAGYACVVYRRHVVELHDLTPTEAAALIAEVNVVAAAIQRLRAAAKINLLSLGNVVPHVHVHVCPRAPGDRFEGRPLDPGDTTSVYRPGEHAAFVAALRAAISRPA
jgi:diadenosine tetraphosphate (Ap4A) HIT family hydrolase